MNQIYFYLTEGCNLACRHCYLGPRFDEDGSRHRSLPVELFETAIREAKALGLSGVRLTGGEPLLHPHFMRLLEIIRREELALTIETNGLLCTREIAAEIAKSPGRFVSVSLDGADAATHEWVRGIPGSFYQAWQGIKNLAAAHIPPQIIMSIMRCNAHQIESVVKMAERLGASSVKFNIVQPTSRGQRLHEADETLGVAEVIRLGRYVEMELAPATKLSLLFDYPLAFRPLSRIANGDASTCGILGILGVLPSGQYVLCGMGKLLPELVFGKIAIDPLETVWRESPTLEILRAGMPSRLSGVCGRCLMKHRCLGSCVAQNYYSTGSFWSPFWFCKEAGEAGLFPETRLGRAPL